MRLFTSVIASAILLAASGASALTSFNVVEGSTNLVLNPGQEVTIGIRLSGGTAVYGLGASAYGYNESVIDFVTGSSVASINHAVAIPAVGAFSGLGNVLTNPLGETSIGANGNRVLIFNGVGLVATNTNALDPGLNGAVGGNDAQIRLTFRAGSVGGLTVINIGTGYAGDGEVGAGGSLDQTALTQISVSVIPEPGTALLMGLGLAGLAAAGRRE